MTATNDNDTTTATSDIENDDTTRKLGTTVNDNLRSAFRRLAAHSPTGTTSQFGSITAVSAGVPTPVFNRVFVFESPSGDDLESAITWMAERDDPFWVTAVDRVADEIGHTVGDFDLEMSDDTQPGMALSSLEEVPPPGSAADLDVDIDAATDPDDLDDWATIAESVFEFSPETSRRLTPESVLSDDRMCVLVGRVDDDPVACGLLVTDGDVAGVYTIGVAEDARRRGIGEAMTWEVLRAGREAGCRVGVLQSSEMGYSLYDRMGFETVVDYRHWRLED